MPPEELEKVDIARIDLLCAEGLRGSEDLDLDYCIRTLDGWAEYVKSETKRNQHLFDEHPERFKNSLGYFRMAMMATVLCQDLRMRYNPEREKQLENGHTLRSDQAEKEFFGDSKDVFIHGLIGAKHYGTCASMPFLYVAIARRLGYPVTLATTATHFYVRYEEGNGKHLNVEATEHRAFLTPPDSEYKNPWELHISEDEISGMKHLQPLSNKEILGHALLTRSAVLRSMKQYDKQADTWATAARYLPETPMWKETIHDMQILARNEGEQERRNAMWNQIAQLYVPHGAGYAYFQDKKVRLHLLMNYSTDTAAIEKATKEFVDELRDYVNPFVESGDRRTIQLIGELEQPVVLRYAAASGKAVTIPVDFLPPFAKRMIPPELAQRVADKKLEDGESILAEFWTFYDETMQVRHEAMQKAIQRRAIQNGTGPILVARERVPTEYRDSIPEKLQLRLNGLKNEDDIVNEMRAFQSEEAVRQRDEAERERRNLMQRYGVRSGQEPQVNVPQYLLPSEYRDSMPLELKLRLVGKQGDAVIQSEIARFQLDERNRQTTERANELMRQTAEAGKPKPIIFQLVPGLVLNRDATQPDEPHLPLTPQPQLPINPVTNGKGKP